MHCNLSLFHKKSEEEIELIKNKKLKVTRTGGKAIFTDEKEQVAS